jgi:hypothetical protein
LEMKTTKTKYKPRATTVKQTKMVAKEMKK